MLNYPSPSRGPLFQCLASKAFWKAPTTRSPRRFILGQLLTPTQRSRGSKCAPIYAPAHRQWKKKTLKKFGGATRSASCANHPTTQFISQHRPTHNPCGDLRPAYRNPSHSYGHASGPVQKAWGQGPKQTQCRTKDHGGGKWVGTLFEKPPLLVAKLCFGKYQRKPHPKPSTLVPPP